jgi:hypothetical protein
MFWRRIVFPVYLMPNYSSESTDLLPHTRIFVRYLTIAEENISKDTYTVHPTMSKLVKCRVDLMTLDLFEYQIHVVTELEFSRKYVFVRNLSLMVSYGSCKACVDGASLPSKRLRRRHAVAASPCRWLLDRKVSFLCRHYSAVLYVGDDPAIIRTPFISASFHAAR